jgi:hypothetical protein
MLMAMAITMLICTENHPRISDLYIELPLSALPSVSLRHMQTEVDLSIAVPEGVTDEGPRDIITGYTEWTGLWGDRQVTVGWDWCIIRGVIMVLSPSEIRTNVRIVRGDGHLESLPISRAHIFEWIESVPWRKFVPGEENPA